jgi:hypothetical protein
MAKASPQEIRSTAFYYWCVRRQDRITTLAGGSQIPSGPPDVPKLIDVLKRNGVTVAA